MIYIIRKVLSAVTSELLILFVPNLLSPLYLASYYSYQKKIEREKRINKLSKRMILIANDYVNTEEEKIELLDDINRVELFYKVYKQIDNLNLRELKILRNFCYALYNPYDLTIVKNHKTETENEIYCKYNNILDEAVDMRNRLKKFFYNLY